LRSVVYRFEGSPAFAHALRDADQELGLPAGESVGDGEWVLAMFEIGEKRRATASAARGLLRAPGVEPVLVFDRRDWERLVDFAEAGSVRMMAVVPPVEAAPVEIAPMEPARTAAWPPPERIAAGTSPAPRPAAAAPGASRSPLKSVPEAKLRVLVVDDEREVCEIVDAMLAAVGLSVESVGSAEAALDRIRAAGCDLVVLDCNLPGMSGLELCRLIRKDPAHATLPLLFLTAQTASQSVVDAFAAGADDYVTKPFRAPELGARILGLLRRARRSAPGP
jgi:two-component system phosphate regulon response regulator PhoB